MDLTARDLARLLNVSEKTIYRWIRDRALPAYRLHEQYRFNRVEVQEWAALQKINVSPEIFSDPDAPGGSPPSLASAIERGGVHHSLHGSTREEVLHAIVEAAPIPAGIDRNRLHQLLLTREALSSTGIGGGIAIPHPRTPLVLQLREPIVVLGFLAHPVDFEAVDRQPVRALFLLLSPTVQSHLQTLAKLSWALHDPGFRALVDRQASGGEILPRLQELERSTEIPGKVAGS
jgi:PTS system nitrogen regulatory IIA component